MTSSRYQALLVGLLGVNLGVVFLDRGKVHSEDSIENLLAKESDPVIDEFFGNEG